MKLAKYIYLCAGIYGILVLIPQYFMESNIGVDYPPPITHPEYFYGFIGAALVWQFVFLFIARNPALYRGIMPITFLEKLVFTIPVFVLYAQKRTTINMVVAGSLDLILCLLFILAYVTTKPNN